MLITNQQRVLYKSIMWSFTIKNKLTAALLLFTVLALVMLTNLQEQRMVTRINKAVTSIYEDRVVVGNYILNLSNHIEEILTLLTTSTDSTAPIIAIDTQLELIEKINSLYDKTVLTEKEQQNFSEFRILCKQIQSFTATQQNTKALEVTKKADYILETLSSIQVEEGKSMLDKVLSMTNTSNILSYIEIVVLIIIAILIQILVLSSKALLVKNQSNNKHHLN